MLKGKRAFKQLEIILNTRASFSFLVVCTNTKRHFEPATTLNFCDE